MKNIIISKWILLIMMHLPILYTQAQGRRPFCSFNSDSGFNFGYDLNVQLYVLRVAQQGDKSGLYEVMEQIKLAAGVSVPITVMVAAEEDNCYATIANGGKRIIVADYKFLVRVNKESGTEWGAISILAHELGHHIAGFGRYGGSTQAELDADYWSGYILQKLGSSREAAAKCILRFGTETDTKSHPNKYSRADTIKTGWDDAKKGYFDISRCESCN